MSVPSAARLYRFGVFEADPATGELRRQGVRVRLHAQPFQLLILLLEHPGEVLSRETISRELWPEGTFVDFDHGVNSAVNRIREALSDTARSPRYVETLARRGYRFVAPVERLSEPGPLEAVDVPAPVEPAVEELPTSEPPLAEAPRRRSVLATEEDLPPAPKALVLTLFALLQAMYLSFYIGALANLPEIHEMLGLLPAANVLFALTLISAALLIPVRTFTLGAALFHAPRAKENFRKLWPFLLVADELWATSPFLLTHHISFGVALACAVILVYSPFAQRSLTLMRSPAAEHRTP